MSPPTIKDKRERVLDVDHQLVEDITALVEADEQGMVRNLLSDLHGADLAQLLTHVPITTARTIFGWFSVEQGSVVLPELDSAYRQALLEEEQIDRVRLLLEEMDTDDATDVVADLPEEMVETVLAGLEDGEEVRELLSYEEDSAGGLMETEYVSALRTWTVAEVTEEVRRMAESIEQILVVYVVDSAHRLEGILSLKNLLLSPSAVPIHRIMKTDIVSVSTELDQEEVARIMERYDLVALPVVDDQGKLVGRITIDDVVDVIREEAEEDIQLMSGVTGGEEPTDSILRITRGRLPWLFVGLIGAGLSGMVIGSFDEALRMAGILAAFIPIMMATAGNVGIQCSAIIVQGLASGDLWTTDLRKRLTKELAVSVINGLALSIVLAAFVLILPLVSDYIAGVVTEPVKLALTAGLSLLAVIILSTILGTLVPLVLHRMGIDPAIATGPFITTSNDIIGLTVFFLIASRLYLS